MLGVEEEDVEVEETINLHKGGEPVEEEGKEEDDDVSERFYLDFVQCRLGICHGAPHSNRFAVSELFAGGGFGCHC
jgi:hypothetical protein